MNIFRAYDIRGIYPENLNEELAFKIGVAFAKINPGKIAVGCDARLSSPSLKQKLIEGMTSQGIDVFDLGMITTPMMVFSVSFYGFDGGINITGSHNPKEYNGIKFFTKNSVPVSYESGIKKIEEIVKGSAFSKSPRIGKVQKKDVLNDYTNHLTSKINFNSPLRLKIVIDAGNGVAGKIYSSILRKVGADVVELFCEPDGNFPNHLPDPTEPENLIDVEKKIVEEGADLGFAYDGDGDRLVVIDKAGKAAAIDDIFALLIKHTLQNFKNSKIVYNVSSSMSIPDTIKRYGGAPIECKVGHTYVHQKMEEVDAQFGGELSGHYFFKEIFTSDDAIFASLKLLEFLANNKTSLEKEFAEIPRYHSMVSEDVVIPMKDSKKFIFIETLKKELRGKGHNINDMDGVKVLFEDGWALFRASNTTPLIRYGFESRTKEGFEKIESFVEGIKRKAEKVG
jgi:phosphomannomutase